ncbi:hypothetical protein PITC_068340 [Penicillium italicum]|uniref:Uncharacterized protein n=1 Tax=Penicillium italicum TaxID=40296 RepID=A0A0A2LGN8_PENIT|nr:hypothetical protein PITC_068340 [Penicillium italicum]
MPPAFPTLQDKLLHECRIFKTNLDAQVHILRCDPGGRGKKRIKDVSRAVAKLSVQTDLIINIALDVVAEAHDSEFIRRNTAFWSREPDGHFKFENVFLGMEHDLVRIILALNKGPCECNCADIAGRLEKMARQVSFHLNV